MSPPNTSNIAIIGVAGILAGLRLEDEVIYRLIRRDIMQESSVYRSIFAEGAAEKQREIAINLLRDGVLLEVVARGTGLSIAEVQQLQQQINQPSSTKK